MLDALAALANDAQQLRGLLGMAGLGQQVAVPSAPVASQVYAPPQLPAMAPAVAPAVAPGSPVLDTPERREYIEQRTREAQGAPKEPPLPHLQAKRAERDAYLRSLKLGHGEDRAGLLAQFQGPKNGATGPEKPSQSVDTDELPNMPLATEDPDVQ